MQTDPILGPRSLSHQEFDHYFKALQATYRIYAPTSKPGKGAFSQTPIVDYDEIHDPSAIEWTQKPYFSPKSVVTPIRETLFHFINQGPQVPQIDTRPILLLLRTCDLHGIDRLDQIFLNNGDLADFYYQRRRELIHFGVMGCQEGFESCFCAAMGTNTADPSTFDLALYKTESGVDIYPINESYQTPPPLAPSENLATKSLKIPDFQGISLEVIFNHPLWLEYSRRCIACGRCNTSCVTCSCFTMQDVFTDDNKVLAERRRRWSGCHVDGFSDMAGGHSFRTKNGERMRFKLMHKLYDFHRRFNKHMCVGCGRCTDVCPEYISFSTTIQKVNQIIEEVRASHDH